MRERPKRRLFDFDLQVNFTIRIVMGSALSEDILIQKLSSLLTRNFHPLRPDVPQPGKTVGFAKIVQNLHSDHRAAHDVITSAVDRIVRQMRLHHDVGICHETCGPDHDFSDRISTSNKRKIR